MFRAARLALAVVAGSCLLSAICPALNAAEPADSKPPVLAPTPEEAREHLQRLVDVDVLEDNVSPEAIRDYLERITGITVIVKSYDRKFINLAFRVRQMPVQDVLDLMLEPVGFHWSLKGATLVIGSLSMELMTTEVYDVHDLLGDITATRPAAYSSDSLVELITSMIDPISWGQVGGAGAIQIFSANGRAVLVVNQTQKTQRKIADLLAQLRAVPQVPSAPQTIPKQAAPSLPPNHQKPQANQNPPEKTGATAAPQWWAGLASHIKHERRAPGYSVTSPREFDIKLLAWCVVNVNRVLTIKALVWCYPRPKAWELDEYICQPFESRTPGEPLWRRPIAPVGGMYAASTRTLQRPPLNRDIYDFLSWNEPWPFQGNKRGELLAGEVREHVWLTTVGQKPSLTFPADVPRHFDAPNLDLDALAQDQTDAQLRLIEAQIDELTQLFRSPSTAKPKDSQSRPDSRPDSRAPWKH